MAYQSISQLEESISQLEKAEQMSEIDQKKETWFQIVGAIGYLVMCPMLGFFPQMTGFLPGMSSFLTDKVWITHFRMLMAVVFFMGLVDLLSVGPLRGSGQLVKVTIGMRLYWTVSLLLYVTVTHGAPYMLLGQIVILDVGLPVFMCFAIPDDNFLVVTKTFFTGTVLPIGRKKQLRDWSAWVLAMIGFFVILATLIDSVARSSIFTPQDSTPMLTFAVGITSNYCFALMWVAHDSSDAAHYFGVGLAVMLEVVAALWYMAGAPGYMVANLAVLAGLASAIHLYSIVWQAVLSPMKGEARSSPSIWLIGASAVLTAISSAWFSLSGFFSHSASLLAINIHGQDLLIAMLGGVTGIAALNIKPGSETPTLLMSWFVPMASVYFTCETKILAHIHGGTPFHPSWNTRGLSPIWGGYEIVNFTFFIATFLSIILGTSVTCFYIIKYTYCQEGWSRLLFHGTLMVFVSGWFMAMFIGGLAPPLEIMASADPKVPADATTIPPLFLANASKVDAVHQHKNDLQIGIFLMAAGPLAKKLLPEETSPLSWILIGVGWFLLILGKVRLALGIEGGVGIVNP